VKVLIKVKWSCRWSRGISVSRSSWNRYRGMIRRHCWRGCRWSCFFRRCRWRRRSWSRRSRGSMQNLTRYGWHSLKRREKNNWLFWRKQEEFSTEDKSDTIIVSYFAMFCSYFQQLSPLFYVFSESFNQLFYLNRIKFCY